MKVLEQFGFNSGADEAHQQRVIDDSTIMDAKTYFGRAVPLLETMSGVVLDEVVPDLTNYSGRWHPLGFMVYPLGVHPELGSLRLHVYPRDFRVDIPNGTGIHDHAWYLASFVLAGQYSDDRFELENLGARNDQNLPPGLLRVFRAAKSPGQPDSLTTDGSVVRAHLSDQLVVPAGTVHTIEPGLFHLPTMTRDRFAATLVLDSPSLGYEPQILINRSPDPIFNPRPKIEEDQAEAAMRQILACSL